MGEKIEEFGSKIYSFHWMIHQEVYSANITNPHFKMESTNYQLYIYIYAKGLYNISLFSLWYGKWIQWFASHRCFLFVSTQCAVMIWKIKSLDSQEWCPKIWQTEYQMGSRLGLFKWYHKKPTWAEHTS